MISGTNNETDQRLETKSQDHKLSSSKNLTPPHLHHNYLADLRDSIPN